MIIGEHPEAPLVELLLCAADLATQGYEHAIGEAVVRTGAPGDLGVAARYEVTAVAPRALEYRGELLAQTLVEAGYRVAEGRGVGGIA